MKFKTLVLISLIALTNGCSQRSLNLASSVNEGVLGFQDIKKTKQEILEIPYASMYARINNGHQVFLVLALVDINPQTGLQQLKWLSADRAMIVTENGRITKTLNLPHHNLSGINNPISLSANTSNYLNNQTMIYDWQPDYNFGQVAVVRHENIRKEHVASAIWTRSTTLIEETLEFPSLSKSFSNLFWIDENDHVIKSKQWAVPEHLYIELEILKPYSDHF